MHDLMQWYAMKDLRLNQTLLASFYQSSGSRIQLQPVAARLRHCCFFIGLQLGKQIHLVTHEAMMKQTGRLCVHGGYTDTILGKTKRTSQNKELVRICQNLTISAIPSHVSASVQFAIGCKAALPRALSKYLMYSWKGEESWNNKTNNKWFKIFKIWKAVISSSPVSV